MRLPALLLAGALALGTPGGWTFLYEREGIQAFARPGPPTTYRAEATLQVPLAEVAAVLADSGRQKEWVSHLAESVVREGDLFHHYVLYNRFHLPWPASDRDVVTDNRVRFLPREKRVQLAFHAIEDPAVPHRPGCVRVPRSEGEFTLVETGPSSVHITYTLCLDPGGWLPGWLVRHFVQDAPVTTLRGLKAQIQRTRGEYAASAAALKARWERGGSKCIGQQVP